MLGLASDEGNAESDDPIEQVPNRIQAVVALFPPVDLKEITSEESDYPALRFDPEVSHLYSPIDFVSKDDPPVLLIHGDQDGVVPIAHSERLNAAMVETETTVEFIMIEGAGHSFNTPEHRERVNTATVEFFLKYLGENIASEE